MLSQSLPKIGQCIETPTGGGWVNDIIPISNDDYLLVIVNFAEHIIERIAASDWNDYINSTENWGIDEDPEPSGEGEGWKDGLSGRHSSKLAKAKRCQS